MEFGKPITGNEHRRWQKRKDWHRVYLDGRSEALRVARAMGLWRLSGLKLTVLGLMPSATGELDVCMNTSDLQSIERKLDPASLELRAYLGGLTTPVLETVAEPPISVTGAPEAISAA